MMQAQKATYFNLFLYIYYFVLCLFYLIVDKSKGTLHAVAMALSGYTEEKNTLWRKTCDSLRDQLEHPYLKAIFAFLATEDDNYEEVLVGNEDKTFLDALLAIIR